MKFLSLDRVESQNIDLYKEKYPRSLFNAVVRTRRFHDYKILKIEFINEKDFFKSRSNRLVLTLLCNILGKNDYYEIEFSNLRTVRFDTDYDNSVFTDRSSPFDAVYTTEIDITNDGYYVFESILGNGAGCLIEFKKCRIIIHKTLK